MRHSTITIRPIFIALVFLTGLSTRATSKADGRFEGEWRTTISVVKLKQTADAVTGSFGSLCRSQHIQGSCDQCIQADDAFATPTFDEPKRAR
jgi:hypothetical protein